MKALLIRSIRLPEKIRQAIDDKLKQEQEAAAHRYRLEKEASEAERKRIAAEGEAAANKNCKQLINGKPAKMRGTANYEFKSNNSKVVVIGSGENGMPLILND